MPPDVRPKSQNAKPQSMSAVLLAGEKRAIRMTRTISLLGIALLLGTSGGAQSQAPQPAPGAGQQVAPQQVPPRPLISTTYRVIVPVTVKDSRGQLVGDLTKDEFHIISDDVEQPITGFSSDAVPLSAVVLLDNDLNQHVVTEVQKSLTAIAAGFGPSDEVALVTYEQFTETVSEFSFDNDALFTKLKRLELGSHNSMVIADPTTAGPIVNGQPSIGGMGSPTSNGTGIPVHGSQRYKNTNALDDALFAAGDMLKARDRDRRKIIFLISDGSDSHNNTHTFDQTLHELLVSDIAVYSISVSHSVPIGRSIVQHGASELQKYAADTGGDTYYAGKQPELERLYSDLTEQARNQYTLTFSPQDIHKDQDFHKIEVRVTRPGLTVDTRDGYYLSAISAGH
jgi:VWFA-related protein